MANRSTLEIGSMLGLMVESKDTVKIAVTCPTS